MSFEEAVAAADSLEALAAAAERERWLSSKQATTVHLRMMDLQLNPASDPASAERLLHVVPSTSGLAGKIRLVLEDRAVAG